MRSLTSQKRVLIITGPGFANIELGSMAHRVLQGFPVEIIHAAISRKCYLPVSPEKDMGKNHLEMSGDLFNIGAPRLSREEYAGLCRDDIDFGKVDMKYEDYRWHRFKENAECLSPESLFAQRLRGAAWRADSLLKAVRPDVLFVQQEFSPETLVIISKVAALKKSSRSGRTNTRGFIIREKRKLTATGQKASPLFSLFPATKVN
ncbi:MAG: hypothetical protein LBP78_08690 [Acidaminococcales bacterium]|nr:hypothetical protein [Acidaminococcales bacterium]